MTNHPQRSQSKPVTIVQTREFYGPHTERGLVKSDDGRGLIFSNRREAQAWIEAEDSGTYHQANNEYGRPTYRIAAIDSLPEYLRWQL